MQLIDTTKEVDGDRNLINQKILLIIFRSLNSFSKYAIEMFVSIAQIEWGFVCHWTGGKLETSKMTWHGKFTTT